MTDFYLLELTESELYDVEAVLISAIRKTTSPVIKENLKHTRMKIKQLLEGSERDLMQYC